MKKKYILILLSLLPALFIYLFYRTEKIVINDLFISILSRETLYVWRQQIISALPLHDHVIYSLPEGLWVFCISLTSKNIFVKIGRRNFNLIYFPLIFSIGLEFLQLFQITNGHFDFWDIGSAIAFWAFAKYAVKNNERLQNFFHRFDHRISLCVMTYLIVYLAHAWI